LYNTRNKRPANVKDITIKRIKEKILNKIFNLSMTKIIRKISTSPKKKDKNKMFDKYVWASSLMFAKVRVLGKSLNLGSSNLAMPPKKNNDNFVNCFPNI